MEMYERKQAQALAQYEAMKKLKAEQEAARQVISPLSFSLCLGGTVLQTDLQYEQFFKIFAQAEAARKAVRRMKIVEEAQREEARQIEDLLERQKKRDKATRSAQKRREHEARVRRLQASMTAQERTEKVKLSAPCLLL